MATILAHHLPPPHTHSTSQSPTGPPLLQQLTRNSNKKQQQPVIVIHSHPTTLHLFTNNSLQSAWSFPSPIVSYSYSCSNSNFNGAKQRQRQQHQEYEDDGIILVVATQDGSIWNVPLPVTNANNNSFNQKGGGGSTKNQISAALGEGRMSLLSSPEIAIKVEDDDNSKRLEVEEEEEVELWNDEDGLVVDEDFNALDSLFPPANKRQRTASPSPTTASAVIPHGVADRSHKVQLVNNAQHLIGSEANVSHIAFVAGDLLIFRYGEGLVHWTSSHQFVPHTEITRQFVPKAHNLQAVARISEYPLHRTQDGHAGTLFVETRASVIYRISISAAAEGTVAIQEMFTAKEPIAALLVIPSKTPGRGQSLLVVGSRGTMSWNETQVGQDGTPLASAPKTLALDMDLQSAFVAEEHLYVFTGKGRLLRLPLASLKFADHKDQEIMDLPPLCAISPIFSNDDTKTIEGLYGFNQQGQLLKFPAEWKKHARTQGVVDARETVGRALSELENLSDLVKRLETQCRLENQRIATYNRLVFELQQSVLATFSRQDISAGGGGEDVDMNMEAGLLIETSLSTFSHVVSDGYEGTKRFYARLRIKSRANIDWSRGWSVGVNVTRKVEFCPHGKPTTTFQQYNNTRKKKESWMHNQTYASLRMLTCHTPWTLDIELNREMLSSLLLQVSIGLLFREPGLSHQSKAEDGQAGEGGFSAYFVVDSLDLDVVDFVEGVEDPLKRDVPAFVQRHSHPPTITNTNNVNSKDKDKEDDGCMQCKVEKGNTSGTDTTGTDRGTGTGMMEAASVFRPIKFEIDTTSIPIPQCLPALLLPLDSCHDGRKAVKIVDMLIAGGKSLGLNGGQACFRTCFIVPDECLSSSGRSDLFPVIRPPTQQGMQGYWDQRSNFNVDAVRSSRNINAWASVGVGLEAGGGLGAGGHGQIEDPDLRCVWIDLEVPSSTNSGGRSGQQQQQQQEEEGEGVVRAQVLVRGSDLKRVFVVRQAIERRIRALFD